MECRTQCVADGRTESDSHIKVLACPRLLRPGAADDELDDSERMTAETLRMYFRHFAAESNELYVA